MGDPGYRSTRYISSKTEIAPAVVDHFLEGLAKSKNNPKTEGAKWGLSHSQAQAVAAYAKFRIRDMREAMSGMCASISTKSLMELDNRMSDPDELDELGSKDLASIGKAMIDAGSTLESGKIDLRGGGGSVVNVGELKVLINLRETEKRVPIEEKLRSIGKDPEKYLREATAEESPDGTP